MVTFAGDDAAPKLNAEQMLCLVQVRVGQAAANNLVHARENNVVQRCQGNEQLSECRLVSHVADLALGTAA